MLPESLWRPLDMSVPTWLWFATIGGLVGGGMAAGTVAVVAAPAVAAAGLGASVFMLSRRLRRTDQPPDVDTEATDATEGGSSD